MDQNAFFKADDILYQIHFLKKIHQIYSKKGQKMNVKRPCATGRKINFFLVLPKTRILSTQNTSLKFKVQNTRWPTPNDIFSFRQFYGDILLYI